MPNPSGVGDAVVKHLINQDSWCYLTQNKPSPVTRTVLEQQGLPRGTDPGPNSCLGAELQALKEKVLGRGIT